MNIIKWFVWVWTGCPMYIGVTTAGVIAAGVGAAASIGGGLLAGQAGAKGIKGPSQEVINAALNANQMGLNQTIALSDEAQRQKDAQLQEAYKRIQGYQQPYLDIGAAGNQQLMDYMGRPAQAARAASGTSPEELARLQSEFQAKQTGLSAATERANALKNQLGTLKYSPQTAPMIAAIQQQYNQAIRDQQAIQSQFDQASSAFQQAQATPYQAAQEAQAAVPGKLNATFGTPANKDANYDYTLSRNKNVTSEEINKWLGEHPELDDAGIMKAMRDSGVSVDQLAAATGTPANEIIRRITAVNNEINPYNQRAVPKFTPYGEPIPEFTSYGEPIPEYKKLTEAEMIANDPGYAFRLREGQKALENQALSKGKFFSGDTAQALTDYNQNYASGEFGAADARNTNNFLQSLTQWNTGYNQNNSDWGNKLAQWATGFDKNNSDFGNQQSSWLNDYNAFVNDQDRLFNKISGISAIGAGAANTLSNAAGNLASGLNNNIDTASTNKINAWQNLGKTVSNTLLGQDQENRAADAQRGIIKGNTITSGVNNLLTATGLADWSKLGGGGGGASGGGGTAPKSFIPNASSAGGFWGGNTLRSS